MSQVPVIRRKVLLEDRSIRSVAAETGVSRNTVRKHLTLGEPKRVQRIPRRAPVREEAEPRIEKLFEELRGGLTAKQRLTGTRVVELLQEDGFTGGSGPLYDDGLRRGGRPPFCLSLWCRMNQPSLQMSLASAVHRSMLRPRARVGQFLIGQTGQLSSGGNNREIGLQKASWLLGLKRPSHALEVHALL